MQKNGKKWQKKDFVVQNPYFIHVVPSRRLERLTYGLEGSCSIQLSYEGVASCDWIEKLSSPISTRFILSQCAVCFSRKKYKLRM